MIKGAEKGVPVEVNRLHNSAFFLNESDLLYVSA